MPGGYPVSKVTVDLEDHEGGLESVMDRIKKAIQRAKLEKRRNPDARVEVRFNLIKEEGSWRQLSDAERIECTVVVNETSTARAIYQQVYFRVFKTPKVIDPNSSVV